MIYPIFAVTSVIEYLEGMAQVLAEVATRLGVPGAQWQRNPTGLWLRGRKLASCGIHVRRGIVTHGFAFNVSTPSHWWQLLSPCGMESDTMTSIAEQLEPAHGKVVPVSVVADMAAPLVCKHIQRVRADIR